MCMKIVMVKLNDCKEIHQSGVTENIESWRKVVGWSISMKRFVFLKSTEINTTEATLVLENPRIPG